MQNLEPDEYRLYGVYEDQLRRLTAGGEDAVVTVKR